MSERTRTLRRRVWRVLRVLLLAAVVAGGVYWLRDSPVAVEAGRAEKGPLVAEVMGTGTLEARVAAIISPKISGRIEEILVDQGDRVTKDQRLVRLADDELQQQVAIAQANLDAVQASLARLNTDRERALAVADQARKSYNRVASLVTKSAATQEEFDRSTEALAVAEAGLASAEAAIQQGQKELVAAEKTLEYHRARLRDTEIDAPFDGLIVQRQRDPGSVVVPGSAILTLISTDLLWISAWVDETEISRLNLGQPARVVFRSESSQSRAGEVARLGREADRETREFVVDVQVLELPDQWAVGQRAEVYIETARKDEALLVPAEFLMGGGPSLGVFVQVDGRAQWRPVTLGLRSQDTVEVVQGLEAGDVLVRPRDPRTSLTTGRRVLLP